MGAFDEEEQTYWPPNENPLNIDKEWRLRAETELNEDPEKAKENMKLLAKKLAGNFKYTSTSIYTFTRSNTKKQLIKRFIQFSSLLGRYFSGNFPYNGVVLYTYYIDVSSSDLKFRTFTFILEYSMYSEYTYK